MPAHRKHKSARDVLRPSRTQELLLQAAFAPEGRFADAWQRWCTSLQGAPPALDDYPLLQLLAPRLRALADDVPYVRLCREQYRLTWAKAKIMERLQEEAIAVLDACGIKTMLLKGAALVPLYYKDQGLRALGDLDLLVRPEAVAAASAALEAAGWRKLIPGERFDSRFSHALTLVKNGGHVDLHAHVQHLNLDDEDDRPFWEKAEPFIFGDHRSLVLSPPHQLIHQIAHAWSNTPSPRWVADVLTVLRGTAIDWDEFERMSAALRLSPIVTPALEYLMETFGESAPQAVLATLRQHKTPPWRHRQLRLAASSSAGSLNSFERHCWRVLASGRYDFVKAATLVPAYVDYVVTSGGHRSVAAMMRQWFVRRLRLRTHAP